MVLGKRCVEIRFADVFFHYKPIGAWQMSVWWSFPVLPQMMPLFEIQFIQRISFLLCFYIRLLKVIRFVYKDTVKQVWLSKTSYLNKLCINLNVFKMSFWFAIIVMRKWTIFPGFETKLFTISNMIYATVLNHIYICDLKLTMIKYIF